MSAAGGSYVLELFIIGGPPIIEAFTAGSAEEAIMLAELRLLLGSDYAEVRLWGEGQRVAIFTRDSLRPDFRGPQAGGLRPRRV